MLGQYFTPEPIADQMVSMIRKPKKSLVLEPSAGKGVFLKALNRQGFQNICAVEIDSTLENESNADIIYDDFLTWGSSKKYDVIIGNPPYIRWKHLSENVRNHLRKSTACNGLMDILHAFIMKSLDVLADNGELIMITPDYWLKTLHAKKLREKMLSQGYLEKVVLYGEERVFKNVISSIMIFKFVKSDKNTQFAVIDMPRKKHYKHAQFTNSEIWAVMPRAEKNHINHIERACDTARLGDLTIIGNGMVSGLDKAFRINDDMYLNTKEMLKIIKVIKAFHMKKYVYSGYAKYILLNHNDDIKNFPNFKKHLSKYREQLNRRYDYKNNTKWFEWSFLRNYNTMSRNHEKIIVPCKERINKKQFVRFSYAYGHYYTTQDVGILVMKPNVLESIKYILGVLNSDITFDWIKSKGMIRGGVVEFSERPLANIPIKRINWDNKQEVRLHNDIVQQTDLIINQKSKNHDRINNLVNRLYFGQ